MTTNNLISRDALLGKTARRYMTVDLPGGEKARIQSLTELEKSEFEFAVISTKGKALRSKMVIARRTLVVLCLVDNDGKRILSDADLDALAQIDGAVISAIYDEARIHCGFEEGDIEGLAKNSESVPVEGSPSTSPVPSSVD